jgi:O-antigen/teichoic acid export membrane protein
MRAFAAFSAMRFILILVAVLVLLRLDQSASALALCFTIAEVVLLVRLLVYVNVRLFVLRWPTALGRHIREHVWFGIRGVFSGFIADLNTRVDVLMLGCFTSDGIVGIYSMAAMLAEGFYQLPNAIQRNVNPIIGKCFADRDLPRIEDIGHRIRRILHPGMALLGLAAAAAIRC